MMKLWQVSARRKLSSQGPFLTSSDLTIRFSQNSFTFNERLEFFHKRKLGHVRRYEQLLISSHRAVRFGKEYFSMAIRCNLLLILQVCCKVGSPLVVTLTNLGKLRELDPQSLDETQPLPRQQNLSRLLTNLFVCFHGNNGRWVERGWLYGGVREWECCVHCLCTGIHWCESLIYNRQRSAVSTCPN